MIKLHWNVTLLSMASEQVSEEIEALHPIEQLSQRAFSSTSYIIEEEDANSLIKSLSRQGYTVRVEQP